MKYQLKLYAKRKEFVMLAFLGLVAVACSTLVVYVATSSAALGLAEILIIAIFGVVGLAAIIAFTSFCIARYTANKIKRNVKNAAMRVKRAKRLVE